MDVTEIWIESGAKETMRENNNNNNVYEDEQSLASTSDQELSNGHSGNNGSSTTGDMKSDSTGCYSNDQAIKGQFARRETANVNRLRYLVLASLLVAAAGVSVLVFFISNNAQEDEMHAQFHSASVRLAEAFDRIRTARIATLASLAVAAIAHGVDHKRAWPFVTLSSYQQRAYTAKQNSGVLQVSIAPLVTQENRALWEEYIVSNEADVDWMERSIAEQDDVGEKAFIKDYSTSFRGNMSRPFSIQSRDLHTGEVVPVPHGKKSQYLPFWEMSPFLSFDEVNIDMMQRDDPRGAFGALCLAKGAIVIGDFEYHVPGGINASDFITSSYAQLLSISEGEEVEYLGDPMSNLFIPIFDSFEDDRVPKAVLIGLFNWGNLFKRVLPPSIKGIDLVLQNNCSEPFTFRVTGSDVTPRGKGDLHDPAFERFKVTTAKLESGTTADGTKSGLGFVDRGCFYSLSIYPSQVFADDFVTATPWVLVSAVVGVLLFAMAMFIFYDYLVERRQTLVLRKAVQSTAIVSSLFPKTVRDRLMNATSALGDEAETRTVPGFQDRLRKKASTVPRTDKVGTNDDFGDTIADLFPSCTVLFADIAGFTAWSSTREPSQVFTLLQNLYQAFDKVAARRRVFKVETIGDSYVAVTGLPEPQEAHAVIMAKFAKDCLQKMHEVTSALEVRLGPDTCDLSMRFGLNSGQVTGGVLRGDRARFQLFGDTVNTAARMESTGERGRIQLSKSTAELLMAAGKEHWLTPREEPVTVKGKGVMNTFWLETAGARANFTGSDKDLLEADHEPASNIPSSSELVRSPCLAFKQESRLIGWMTEVLLDYVKQIVAKNKVSRVGTPRDIDFRHKPGTLYLDELVESFALPKENYQQVVMTMEQYRSIELDPAVAKELRAFVTEIADRYHDTNPFHNFAHACHVTMSVHKLMKRVVSDGTDGSTSESKDLHKATYGILTSDPLTLFAIVFTGLIHDVDHAGVSNMQLTLEQPELAKYYRYKSIAEQNSLEIAWGLLMSPSYNTLRRVIFPTESDLKRFRQVVVNSVLATDIFDKEMSDMRKARWDRVFGGAAGSMTTGNPVTSNTRATIVLEYIIQASDVSHTMQHWHVYTKWNRRLFEEMRLAFAQGRMAKDPAAFWYEGELGFFDNYVIPLAKKLQECRVFGVSSDECLNYALSNRNEWEAKGKSIVQDMTSTMNEIDENTDPNVKGRLLE